MKARRNGCNLQRLVGPIRLIRGWIRLFVFRVCPACNSKAPSVYHCGICGFDARKYPVLETALSRHWWRSFRQANSVISVKGKK